MFQGGNAPLMTGAPTSAIQALRGLTVGQWAAGSAGRHTELAAQAAAVVDTLARRFGTDQGRVIRALTSIATATGLPLIEVARKALVRPVVPYRDWMAAIRRFGVEVSYILRHPGQDLTDLSVSYRLPPGFPASATIQFTGVTNQSPVM